jgi:hypothetical protein
MIIKSRISMFRDLEGLPGVGAVVAQELWSLGIRTIEELKNTDPEELYLIYQARKSGMGERTMLYMFRCAVYYASHREHNPELLKWWNWKSAQASSQGARGDDMSSRY